jgi:dinuclear metal center YbgI/SA1388 family protein
MKISEIVGFIESVLPKEMALLGDRVGLQVDCDSNTDNIIICYELTSEVISEARKINCKLIISFHPLIFNPLEEINSDERVGRLTQELIRNDISLYVVHTAFDRHPSGTSKLIADKLGLIGTEILFPDENNPKWGMGIIGEFENDKNFLELLHECYHIFNSPIKYSRIGKDSIKKVAIIGGSGMSWANEILDIAPDLFITADTKYHDYHMFEGKVSLLDPGHYEMEQFVTNAVKNILEDKFPKDLNLYCSNSYSNPISYFPDQNYTTRQKNYISNI